MNSEAELLAFLPEAERDKHLNSLTAEQAEQLTYSWEFWSRPEQRAPKGDWFTWLVLAGRGFGKTRLGAEWIRQEICGDTPLSGGETHEIALIGETAADTRDVMVEGPAGLLHVHPPEFRPVYEPSKRLVTWPNGAKGHLYNATEPDQLRGPQHHIGWCDELAKWRYAQETWDMLQFGLRLGTNPRQLITTTPRPIPLLKKILSDPATEVTRGSTYDNRSNLAAQFFDKIVKQYEGTRLGRQELQAEILDDVPGSLWTRANFDEHRVTVEGAPHMQRIIVAIDPPAGAGDDESLAECGIMVVGLGVDGRGYVIDDLSCRMGPIGWARRAVSAVDMYDADAIVAEINQGGAMVTSTIKSVRETIKVIEVRASRGKVVRAEPISALYEQGRVSHIGGMAELEDQMVLFTPWGIEGDTTADRVDALVWGLTEIFPQMVKKDQRKKHVKIEGLESYSPHAMRRRQWA